MTQLTFFNTIDLSGQNINDALHSASKQNDRIYLIMKLKGGKFTPFKVQKEYEQLFAKTPITSIRRAMTTLTYEGKLKKLEEMADERFGKPNHYWIAV